MLCAYFIIDAGAAALGLLVLSTVNGIHYIGTRYGKRPFLDTPIWGQSSVAEELRKDMDHREWEKLQVEWNS